MAEASTGRGNEAVRPAPGDPFGEHTKARFRRQLSVLGSELTVESASAAFLQLAIDAFGGLPRYRLARRPPRCQVRLVITDHRSAWRRGAEPPRPVLTSGGGLLCATVDAGNFAIVDPAMSRALICVSPAMLRHPYHVRYELIELAIVTLASRVQSLVPLHAACVGADDRGLLLMGSSGAGKSTLALHALAGGMQFLSEDSAFVTADCLRLTGVPSYLNVQPSALEMLPPGSLAQQIRRSRVIQRRSGARKFELDLRNWTACIAPAPLRLAATVFLSRQSAGRKPALRSLGRRAFLSRLRHEQPYAAGLANWSRFVRRVTGIPAYELRRTAHPDVAVGHLQELLADAAPRP
jgi:hypothetical protein